MYEILRQILLIKVTQLVKAVWLYHLPAYTLLESIQLRRFGESQHVEPCAFSDEEENMIEYMQLNVFG